MDDWKSKLGLVYSTNENQELSSNEEIDSIENSQQNLIVKLEKKGRGGKTVTIIENYVGSDEDLKNLAKKLKNKCGVGGSIKDNNIIIQGNVRNKILDILKKDGFNTKRVGA